MHRAYCVVPVGTPKSDCAVGSPLTHFHTSLSFASSALSLRRRIDLTAVRQPASGLAGCIQPPTGSQESCVQRLPSSQSSGVPGRQVPAPSHVSAPLQTVLSAHELPTASTWQVEEQQSPFEVLPSSQSSFGSI